MIIQIIGLPGSGKTTLAQALLDKVDAIHLNADEVRATVNSDLGFSQEDRVENARRLGTMAKLLSNQGNIVIVDFVCPTSATRDAFGEADFIIWMDRTPVRNFADTTSMWELPEKYDVRFDDDLEIWQKVKKVIDMCDLFDWSEPTTLMLGRYQPWHEGHQALKQEAHKRTNQVLIGVRNTHGTSEKDPFTYEEVVETISEQPQRNVLVMRLPNITNIVYGRDVGYSIEKVELSQEIQQISATQKRKEMGL